MAAGDPGSPIPAEALALIGTEVTVHLGPVATRDIVRYAVATGDTNPLYTDPEAARQTAYGEIIAPPAMPSAVFWTTDGVAEGDLRQDGLSRAEPIRIPLKVKRAMGGGQELEFFEPVRPGDELTRTDRVVDIYERESKLGVLAFTVTEQVFRNQHGTIVMTCRSTSISH